MWTDQIAAAGPPELREVAARLRQLASEIETLVPAVEDPPLKRCAGCGAEIVPAWSVEGLNLCEDCACLGAD